MIQFEGLEVNGIIVDAAFLFFLNQGTYIPANVG